MRELEVEDRPIRNWPILSACDEDEEIAGIGLRQFTKLC